MSDSRGVAQLQTTGNMAENWRIWRARFENYLVASEVIKKEEKTQCAQLLHYIGEEGFIIYTTFKLENEEREKLNVLLTKFQEHFEGKENRSYEIYKFFTYKQQEEQSTENFITELKKQASKCKLENLEDSLTVTMLICGIKNNTVRERLLQEEGLSLDKAIELCKVIEASKLRSEAMASGSKEHSDEVLAIKRSDRYEKIIQNCNKCGKSHKINKCPAYGKHCNYCKMINHYESVCF